MTPSELVTAVRVVRQARDLLDWKETAKRCTIQGRRGENYGAAPNGSSSGWHLVPCGGKTLSVR